MGDQPQQHQQSPQAGCSRSTAAVPTALAGPYAVVCPILTADNAKQVRLYDVVAAPPLLDAPSNGSLIPVTLQNKSLLQLLGLSTDIILLSYASATEFICLLTSSN